MTEREAIQKLAEAIDVLARNVVKPWPEPRFAKEVAGLSDKMLKIHEAMAARGVAETE